MGADAGRERVSVAVYVLVEVLKGQARTTILLEDFGCLSIGTVVTTIEPFMMFSACCGKSSDCQRMCEYTLRQHLLGTGLFSPKAFASPIGVFPSAEMIGPVLHSACTNTLVDHCSQPERILERCDPVHQGTMRNPNHIVIGEAN